MYIIKIWKNNFQGIGKTAVQMEFCSERGMNLSSIAELAQQIR